MRSALLTSRCGYAALLFLASLVLGCSESSGRAGPDPGAAAASSSAASAPSDVGGRAVAKLGVSGLTEREQKDLNGHLGALFAPCSDTPVSLAQCIAEDRACAACKPAGQFVARAVRAGQAAADIKEIYTARFDAKAIETITTEGNTTKGPADAVVNVVEWADFECPHCAEMNVMLELVRERYPGQVAVTYRFYVLPTHNRALDAAKAAVAAANQGKFWEMHALLFEHQDKLETTDFMRYAKTLELDPEKFRVDYSSDETSTRIKNDMKRADELKLDGTPLIFISGRRLPLDKLQPFLPELLEWVKLDIELAGKTPAAPSEKFRTMTKELGIDEALAKDGAAPLAPPPIAPPSAGASAEPAPSASAGPASSASAGPAPGR